jgi:regulator of RNase E activity RraA
MERSQNTAEPGPPNDRLATLAGTYVAMVSDALDRLGHRHQVLAPRIGRLGSSRIAGRAFPIVVAATTAIPDEPYQGEMNAIEAIAPGDVLMYGGDDTLAAVFGELFAYAALGRGAVGAIVDGYIRDSQQLVDLGYPVFARGVSPLDTRGRAEVVGFGERVSCGGVDVVAGDYVLGDRDGVVIVPAAAIEDVLAAIPAKSRDEQGARLDIKAGVGIRDVWDRWRAF